MPGQSAVSDTRVKVEKDGLYFYPRGPAFKVDDFTGRLVEDRAMVQGIVDIGADVEYVLVHRRLAGSRGEVVPPTS